MKPPEDEIRLPVAEWIRKADLDLKALLTRHQVEFPKTHELRRLLELLRPVEPAMAKDLEDLKWLEPFGVEIRYPAGRPDTLPGEEVRTRQLGCSKPSSPGNNRGRWVVDLDADAEGDLRLLLHFSGAV